MGVASLEDELTDDESSIEGAEMISSSEYISTRRSSRSCIGCKMACSEVYGQHQFRMMPVGIMGIQLHLPTLHVKPPLNVNLSL